MEKARKKNNAKNLFGVGQIPTDNQIRTTLDPIAPDHLEPLFTYGFNCLKDN